MFLAIGLLALGVLFNLVSIVTAGKYPSESIQKRNKQSRKSK